MLKTDNLIINLLDAIVPVNLDIEKERFFKNFNYNPLFIYKWEKHNHYLFSTNKAKRNLFKALRNQDSATIVDSAMSFFNIDLSPQYLKLSQKILEKNIKTLEKPKLEKIISSFRENLKYFNLDYKITIVQTHAYNIRPSFKNKEILISSSIDLSKLPLEGEIKHELVHLIRSENNDFNKIIQSTKYLSTDEGLASYFQDYTTKNGDISLYHHAVDFSATNISLNNDFKNLFDYYKSFKYSDEYAWKRTIRHKFGFKNTSIHGDIMKPAVYFYMEQKIKELTKTEQLKLLIGKISIDELEDFSDYKGKFSKEIIYNYLFS